LCVALPRRAFALRRTLGWFFGSRWPWKVRQGLHKYVTKAGVVGHDLTGQKSATDVRVGRVKVTKNRLKTMLTAQVLDKYKNRVISS